MYCSEVPVVDLKPSFGGSDFHDGAFSPCVTSQWRSRGVHRACESSRLLSSQLKGQLYQFYRPWLCDWST